MVCSVLSGEYVQCLTQSVCAAVGLGDGEGNEEEEGGSGGGSDDVVVVAVDSRVPPSEEEECVDAKSEDDD